MKSQPSTADADLGVTTIAGDSVGVVTRGEVRSLPVYGPGGYVWLPENGAEVLVIKGGPGGEEQCVAGLRQKETPKGMQPGEVYLYGPGNNSIYLKRDGSVEIQGQLWINGALYTPCNCGGVLE
jgi:phage gp45-like